MFFNISKYRKISNVQYAQEEILNYGQNINPSNNAVDMNSLHHPLVI